MAYIENQEQEDQQGTMDVMGSQPQSAVPQPTQQQQPTGGQQSATIQAGGAQTAPTAPTAGPKKGVGSGMFTNIQKYLKSNQPRAQKMAQATTQKLGQQAQDIRAGIEKQRQQFSAQLSPEKQRLAGGKQFVEQQIQQATAPGQVSEQDLAKFQTYRTAGGQIQEIQGPALAEQQRRARELEQQARQAGTSEGRFRMLRETFKRPTYGTGQATLDRLLLGGSKAAREALISGAQQATAGLQQDVRGARQASAEELGQLRREAADIGRFTEERIGAEQQALRGELEARAQAQTELSAKLAEAARTGQYTPELLQQAGLEAGRLYGVDTTKYLTGREASLSAVAGERELAKARALGQLADRQQQIITDPTAMGMDVTGAQALEAAIERAKQSYETERDPIQKRMKAAQAVQDNLGAARSKYQQQLQAESQASRANNELTIYRQQTDNAVYNLNAAIRQYGEDSPQGQTALRQLSEINTKRSALERAAEGGALNVQRLKDEIHQHQREAEKYGAAEFAAERGAGYGVDYHGMAEAMSQGSVVARRQQELLRQLEERYGGRIG